MTGNQQSFSFDDKVGKDNEFLEPVVNEKHFPERDEEIIWDKESSSASELQPPSPNEFQIAYEDLENDNHIRVAKLPSQEDLLPRSAPTHQHDGLLT